MHLYVRAAINFESINSYVDISCQGFVPDILLQELCIVRVTFVCILTLVISVVILLPFAIIIN